MLDRIVHASSFRSRAGLAALAAREIESRSVRAAGGAL
jgi:hypothetical protein